MPRSAFDLDAIGAGLPVAEARAELERAAATGAMVVTAPPGTGKTTFVPPLIAELLAGRASGRRPGRVLLTQPRRVAARAAARRIARLDGGGDPGGRVGFSVRGQRRVGADTLLEVVTPGVLLRRLTADPALEGVGAVILDEVHERSVEGELLLGLVAEVRALREDLVVAAMSATLEADRLAELLGAASGSGPAAVVNIPSPAHPLVIDYAPFDGQRLDERGVARDYLAHLARVAIAAVAANDRDALVFVPGAREVDALVRMLREQTTGRPLEVLPLHGRLPSEDQDLALRGRPDGGPQRVVVSTALAESSLTVPGVRLVVDAGLSREVRRDRRRDMTGLVTVSASRASAGQRAGRAARQGAGRAVRVFSETDFARMPVASAPEIASADLTDAALLLAAWGTPGGAGIALPTPPPPEAMRQAVETLRALGLTNETGLLTPLGASIARLPVGAREGRALLAGARELDDPALAADVVAAVSDDHREPGADLQRLLQKLRSGEAPGSDRWRRERRRLEAIARAGASAPTAQAARRNTGAGRNGAIEAADGPGIIVALARPGWIARRAGEHSRSYLLARGTRAALPEGSTLIGSQWLAVYDVQRADGRAGDGTGAVIRLAAPLPEADALRIGEPLLTRHRSARIEEGRVRVRDERRLGAILLASQPASPTADDTGPAFAAHLREAGLSALRWTEAAASLRARLALLAREFGDPWPAMDDAALLEGAHAWIGHDLARMPAGSSLRGIDVVAALRRLLPWPEAARLEELVPERLAVPSGSSVPIVYPDPADAEAPPVVAVKLQEVFGLAETPRLVDGRVPVLFHLLSPARRPLAVTDDLGSFWSGPYQEVRREMRGRYPKHPWPEDPWTAEATARTKRRS